MPKPEPAFPSNPMWGRTGMTLRDWFAGMALQGLIGSPRKLSPSETISGRAYELADAMIKEREVE